MKRSLRILGSLAVGMLALPAVQGGAAGVSLEGDYTQGGLLIGRTAPDARVSLNDQPLRVSPQGVFLVGFGRDEPASAELKLVYADGSEEQLQLEVARRDYQIQRIDGLPPSKVTPPEQDLERIRREAALVKATRKLDDPRTDFLDGFIWPSQGPISGVYGSQRILNGKPRRPHFGVDVAGPVGTPVVAPAGGMVTLAHPDMYFSGGTLVIDHGHGLSSAFLHLSRILVKEGQRVEQGEPIAEIGATGRVTGAHLDWRMNWFEQRIDPQLLAGPMPDPTPTEALAERR